MDVYFYMENQNQSCPYRDEQTATPAPWFLFYQYHLRRWSRDEPQGQVAPHRQILQPLSLSVTPRPCLTQMDQVGNTKVKCHSRRCGALSENLGRFFVRRILLYNRRKVFLNVIVQQIIFLFFNAVYISLMFFSKLASIKHSVLINSVSMTFQSIFFS